MLRSKIVLFILILTLIVPTLAQAQDMEVAWPDLEGREITVAVENAYPPYNYYDENNEAVGWDYDTMNAMCALLNCVPVYVETGWDGMLVAIAAGEFDVAMDGITYTKERDQSVDFSQLYHSYDETLLVREGEDRFSTVEELIALDDFMVATQVGTTNEITAHELFGEDHVMSFDVFGAAIEALQNDDVDAVAVDRPAAEGWIEAQGGLVALDESISGIEGLAFAFPPGSELPPYFNTAMSALEATGAWAEIDAKWFPE